MPSVTGRSQVDAFFADIPGAMGKILRGAARAGGKVVADEAKARASSEDVRDGIVTRVTGTNGLITVKVTVKPGWARSVGTWLEWGTEGHFISVDDSQRQGKTPARINTLAKAGTLVIGGAFVGKTVWHPGARPHPFLRPALDTKEAEAIAAAQSYITTRLKRSGLRGEAEPEGDEE